MSDLRHTKRLLHIAYILAREDALYIFDDLHIAPFIARFGKLFAKRRHGLSKGKRLAAALERLGPAFIKLGQVLSTRSDLIGDAIADDLSDLRDNLPAFPIAMVRSIIEEEFGLPLAALYTDFSVTPAAAASIAQVHRATTLEGRDVAVKILRPGIEESFQRDLALFQWMAEKIERRLPGWKRLKPREVVATLKESVFFELDLRFEAAAATEMAKNIRSHEPGLRVPAIDWNRTSKRVMTSEWIDGIPIHDVEAIRASGFDTELVLAKASRSLFSQVFKDGFFHADLHPGNLFLDKSGDLVAVDFGIMGRLDWNSRLYIAEILRGFLNEDYRHVAQVHFTAGYVPADKSIEAFTQACMAVAKPITGRPLNEISIARLLGQMFSIAAEFEMETQPQLLLLQKTMMVTEGVGRMLNPHLNMWELAKPLIETWASEQLGPAGRAKMAAREACDTVRKFPSILRDMEKALYALSDPRGLRLHPDTLLGMQQARTASARQWLYIAWSAFLLVTCIAAYEVLH